MNTKHSELWNRSLQIDVAPAIWNKSIFDTGPFELFEALSKLKRKPPDTTDRMRRRLAAVFDDAAFFGLYTGNPANTIKRRMNEAAGDKIETRHNALPYAEVPAFTAKLREQKGMAALALPVGLLSIVHSGPTEFIDEDECIRLADDELYKSKAKSGFCVTV